LSAVSWRWSALLLILPAACSDGSDEASTAPPSTSMAGATTTPTTPTTTTSVASAASSVAGVRPVGFDVTAADVTLPDGSVCELCLWVADAPDERSRGLMGVTDLGGPDGMVFVYDAPTAGQFWMRGTPMPLSIAFFAADGSFVSATDMEPCLDGPASACARYAAAAPYTAAIEVPAGGLAELGIRAGSRLALLGPDAERCPLDA
jgi:uncharacterized protein